ncbi:serine/threonine protein kinase [Paenibacillus macerans]|uniref:serine/threonine protein kinase n=1 Tax=Paenibacillus macerans TaxID=44252 RepID=UPI003D32440D
MRLVSFLGSFWAAWRDYRAEPNTLLGRRYLLKEVIGEGSYGITYLGIDQTDESLVAVKQARPSKGLLARQLLKREARILKSLSHRGIPVCMDFMTEGRYTYLVMSILSGETLEGLIFEQGRRYGEADSARITLQLLELVHSIHQQGVVHLDLRIPNVLLHEGKLSVIDFGLARTIGELPISFHPSQPFQPFRSKSIPDPEASRLSSPAEPQSDLLDIGHFMLFLLYSTFESPHSALDTRERSWQEELTLSPELIEIIERLLQLREPYANASQAMAALRAFLSPR